MKVALNGAAGFVGSAILLEALDRGHEVTANFRQPEGEIWLSYNAPEYLKERHGLRDELLKNISGVGGLVEQRAG